MIQLVIGKRQVNAWVQLKLTFHRAKPPLPRWIYRDKPHSCSILMFDHNFFARQYGLDEMAKQWLCIFDR